MRIFRQIAAAVAMVAASVLPASAQQSGGLSGRVFDAEDSRPLADATIVLVRDGRRAYSATSRADGTFNLGTVAAATYDIAVTKIGYSARRFLAYQVKAGAPATLEVGMSAARTNLQTVSVTTGRKPEKTLDAPAQITTVSSEQIRERPAVTVADNLKSVPGLDISTGGIVQSNIVSRGFNNAFSGAMLMLQDYRFAGVPSLRVNVPFLFTGTNEDVERIEVLNGPASALYGPNSGSGALHIITRSPFSSQGTTVSFDGGERSIFRVGLRTAQALGDKVAFKLSGEYMQGKDFQYQDPSEPATFPAGTARAGQPNVRNYDVGRMTGEGRVDIRPMDDMELITTYGFTKIDNGMELTGANGTSQIKNWTYQNIQQRFRWGRLFAQFFVNTSNAGNNSGTDLSGTFLLRSGQPIVDQSSVWSGQLQHGFTAGDFDFTYGGDYIKTNPVTKNTINGRNEDRDNVTEYGGYVQGSWKPSKEWELLAALRGDHHSALDAYFVSPRAAILYKPTRNETWRLTYNRAFNTPANFTFFLDLLQATNAGGSGFNVRAVGNASGWNFDQNCGATSAFNGFCMRSIYVPGASAGTYAQVGANAAFAFNGLATAARPLLGPQFQAGLTGALTQALVGAGLSPAAAAAAAGLMAPGVATAAATSLANGTPTAANIPTRIALLTSPLANLTQLNPIDRLKATYNETFELGWKGTFGNRFSLDVSGWTQLRRDIGSSAAVATPSVWMDALTPAGQAAIGGYIGGRLGAGVAGSLPAAVVQTLTAAPFNLPLAQAQAIAAGITGPVATGFASAAAPGVVGSLARAPLGTIPFSDPLFSSSPDVVATYTTVPGQVWIYGLDAAFQFQIDDQWTLSGTAGGINRNVFPEYVDNSGLPLMSNSPKLRSTLTIRWQEEQDRGISAEVRGRYTDAFQVNSGVYNTGYCNVIAPGNPGYAANSAGGPQANFGGTCPAGTFAYNSQWGGVPVNLMMDLGFSYRFELGGKKALWSITVNNALDNKVPTFAGVPSIGRIAMTRLSYTF